MMQIGLLAIATIYAQCRAAPFLVKLDSFFGDITSVKRLHLKPNILIYRMMYIMWL